MEPCTRKLPGLQAIELKDWLTVDDVYEEQTRLRDELLKNSPQSVYMTTPDHNTATSEELRTCLLEELPTMNGFQSCLKIEPRTITRLNKICFSKNEAPPLITAARMVQEDLLILEKPDCKDQYHLTAGILCFPASWTLAEKIGAPLSKIHEPVTEYNQQLSARINKIFENIHPDRPMCRFNFLIYTDPSLFQPRRENVLKAISPKCPRYVRVERQTLRRLPVSRAIVFAIHTFVVRADSIPATAHAALAQFRPELIP